mgnify:CR=1 FL=1
MHVRVLKPARSALPLAVYDGHGQAATFYYQFAQSGRRQVDARSAELGLLARPQATAKASGGGAKRLEVRGGGRQGRRGGGHNQGGESKLDRIRCERHGQFEAIARYGVDRFKLCTKPPEGVAPRAHIDRQEPGRRIRDYGFSFKCTYS